MIEYNIVKKKKNQWTRQQIQLMNLIQELENELQGMKKRGVNPEFIQKKSDQIDLIIAVNNYAAEFIDLLIFNQSSAALEIQVLETELSKHLMNDPEKAKSFFSPENTLANLKDLIQSFKTLNNED